MHKVFALVLVLILALTTAAYADSTARTLDEIKDSGEIVIGVFSDMKTANIRATMCSLPGAWRRIWV